MKPTLPQFESIIDELQVPIKNLELQGNVHTWWARRSAALSRVLMYLSLLDGHSSDSEFLDKLTKSSPSNKIMLTALNKIRDSQWRRAWRSQATKQISNEIPPEPGHIRVLDPFAGSGSIPLEALRFGCETFAGDLNPVSAVILRSVLQLPQEYFSANPKIIGTSPNQTWNGLGNELQYWAKWVEQKALSATQLLFSIPNKEPRDYDPRYYLWVHSYKCNNQTCPVDLFPFPTTFGLDQLQNTKQYLQYEYENGQFTALVKTGSEPTKDRREIACPVCGTVFETTSAINQTSEPDSFLAVVILNSSKSGSHQYVSGSPQEMKFFVPWSLDHQARLEELLSKPYSQAIKRPITLENTKTSNFSSKGIRTFQDLFSNRQLLVGLEFMASIMDARQHMLDIGLPVENVEVISTYLAVLLGFIIEHNSKLCGWASRGTPLSSFSSFAYRIPNLFVERMPTGVVDIWLNKVLPTLTELSSLPKAQQVYCGDAKHLSFGDNFFDAIVTDPPYYDNVPYSDLADFFWVWESPVYSNGLLELFDRKIRDLTFNSREDYLENFSNQLIASFRECFRVLKPGGVFSILLTSRSGFEEYIDYIQQAGLEITSIKRIPEEIRLKTESTPQTFLVFAQKPYLEQSGQYLAVSPDILAQAIDQGREKQILYSGLAEILEIELDEKDYFDYVPVGAKGSKIEILMEVIALCDLPEFLEKTLGKVGMRKLANQLSLSDALSPLSGILAYFGFNMLSPDSKVYGAKQVSDKLFYLRSRMKPNVEKAYIRGLFIDGSTYVERLIRQTVWGWSQIAFGREKRDEVLLSIVNNSTLNNHRNLDHLAFGHIALLFRELPDAIVLALATNAFRTKLGRPHIYKPRQKNSAFGTRLDELVALRNKVEHDKDGYWSSSSLSTLISDCTNSLESAQKLIDDLASAQAIPNIAVPKLKVEDQFGRVSYSIQLDNGNDLTVFSTHALKLGGSYLYFSGASNPNPVDPLLLMLDEIGPIP